jgi:Fe2+ transport system protein FeoA
MITAAPLGDPVQFEVRGFNVSLRKAEAAVVRVDAV